MATVASYSMLDVSRMGVSLEEGDIHPLTSNKTSTCLIGLLEPVPNIWASEPGRRDRL